MADPSDKQMLRDANGDLIPQYWDIQDEEFKPLTGQDGAQDTRLIGSNVEDDQAIPTKLLSSNKSNNYLEGRNVPAGGRVTTEDIDFTGTRIGVGVRFDSATDFSVEVNAKGTGSSSVVGTERILVSERGSAGITSYMLKAQRHSIQINNNNSHDETLRFVTITEFMSSGGAGTHEID